MLDWGWIKSVLIGPAPPASLDRVPAHGILRGLGLSFFVHLLLLVCVATLPTSRTTWIRLLLFPIILHYSLVISIDRSITFGSAFADAIWTGLGWDFLSKAINICIGASFLDKSPTQRAPRWIVPKSQAAKWQGSVKLSSGTGERKAMNGSATRDENHEKQHIVTPQLKVNGLLVPTDHTSPAEEIEAVWYAIPHPPLFSLRRVLWSIDYLYLIRPQTSWILPKEQRAMEWAHGSFLRAASDPSASPYGKAEERSLITALGKVGLFALLLYNNRLLVIPPGPAFYSIPLTAQLFNVLFYGSTIACTTGPSEYLYVPLLRLFLPATAIVPMMNQPLLATGPIDFWGRRWHHMVRRTAWRLGRLFPWGDRPIGNKVWAFFVTGCLHSFLLARWLPEPPNNNVWYGLVFMIIPGPISFFLAQGALVALESILFGIDPAEGKKDGPVKSILRRMLLWGGMAFTCRWFVGAIASTGMHIRGL